MSQEMMRLYTVLGYGNLALLMLTDLGGIWVCLAHRKLSAWLILAAFGFAGLLISAAIEEFASLTLKDPIDLEYVAHLLAAFTNCVSSIFLVFGLGATLVDIRQKLSRSLDPPNVRR